MTSNELPSAAPCGDGNEIVFDAKSGISAEEQREILSKINGIAETNRRSLAAGNAAESGTKQRFTAKKSGGFVPVLVNAAAVVLLGGGFLLLSAFQGKTDARVREGPVVYNSAERALIEEIRKETASRIAAKEQEIALVVSRLEGVDGELRELHSSNQELNAEQLAAEGRLTALQEEYRSSLSSLRDERSQILEEARARESNLRSQLEARIRELTAASEQNRSELEQSRTAFAQSDAALSSARSELEKLSGEQEKAAAIEAQMAGSFALVNDQILKNDLAGAADTLRFMRAFLDTASFQGVRSFRARRGLYVQAINSMEAIVAAALKSQAGGAPSEAGTETDLAELRLTNARLEQTVASLTRTLDAASSQGSGLTDRLGELEKQSAELQTKTAEKDRTIAALESEKTNLSQTVAARENTVKELQAQGADQQAQITNLTNQLTTLRQALQALSQ